MLGATTEAAFAHQELSFRSDVLGWEKEGVKADDRGPALLFGNYNQPGAVTPVYEQAVDHGQLGKVGGSKLEEATNRDSVSAFHAIARVARH